MASRWYLATRFLSIDQRDARGRITLDYALNTKFSLGVEANPLTGEIQPRGTWFIQSPSSNQPGWTLGAAADRLSTPKGHAFFLTASMPLDSGRVTPFASVKLGTETGAIDFPFGANLTLATGWTWQAVYDGNHTHMLLSRTVGDQTWSFVLARMESPGLQVSYQF